MGKSIKMGLCVSFTLLIIVGIFPSSPVRSNYRDDDYIKFSKTFGRSKQPDSGVSVQMNNDGGYMISGTTMSFGSGRNDIWLIKTDEMGNEIWNKTFGEKWTDVANSMERTDDGGYIIVGYAYPETGDTDKTMWVIKLDSNGDKQWDRFYHQSSEGRSIQQTSDGGYIIVGYADSYDVILLKIDKDGNEEWSKYFGTKDYSEWGYFGQQTSDGGYIILSHNYLYTPDPYNYVEKKTELCLIKTDKSGNEEWNKTFGEEKLFIGFMILQTKDGGYIVIGYESSYDLESDRDIWLMKTDDEGNKEWEKTVLGDENEMGQSILSTQDGGYIFTGSGWLIKIDSMGNEEWTRDYGGQTNDIKSTPGGGYVITGSKDSDVWLFKIDSLGRLNGTDEPKPNGVEDNSDEGGLKLYVIIGISAAVLLIVVICLVMYVRRKRKGVGEEEREDSDEEDNGEKGDGNDDVENKVICPECEWENDPSSVSCKICETSLKE